LNSSLPELLEKKKRIDMHTNIATALLDEIKERKLDTFFEAEEKMITKSTMVRRGRVRGTEREMGGGVVACVRETREVCTCTCRSVDILSVISSCTAFSFPFSGQISS
jgi:hypothetical protein